MLLVFVLIPVVALVAAALAAFISVGRSTLALSSDGVEIRNYPQAATRVALADALRFEPTPSVGNFSALRPATAVLVCTDGRRIPVRKLEAPGAGRGVDALNDRLVHLRKEIP